jgi:hypothetical protein
LSNDGAESPALAEGGRGNWADPQGQQLASGIYLELWAIHYGVDHEHVHTDETLKAVRNLSLDEEPNVSEPEYR